LTEIGGNLRPMLLQGNLTVRHEKASNGISMSVDTGELVSLVGPNGAGNPRP
jgi:ABC-type Mn2+/Zn2+ transport system ATPase subunit